MPDYEIHFAKMDDRPRESMGAQDFLCEGDQKDISGQAFPMDRSDIRRRVATDLARWRSNGF